MGRARCCVGAQTRPLGFYGNVLGTLACKLRLQLRNRQNQRQQNFRVLPPRPRSAKFVCGGWLQQSFSKCEGVLRSRNVQEEVLGSLSVDCINALGSPRKWLVNPRKSLEVLESPRKFSEVPLKQGTKFNFPTGHSTLSEFLCVCSSNIPLNFP